MSEVQRLLLRRIARELKAQLTKRAGDTEDLQHFPATERKRLLWFAMPQRLIALLAAHVLVQDCQNQVAQFLPAFAQLLMIEEADQLSLNLRISANKQV